jgi:hypothetical protein
VIRAMARGGGWRGRGLAFPSEGHLTAGRRKARGRASVWSFMTIPVSLRPTDPQDQKTKASVNLIALKAQRSKQVRHNPDRQPGQPPPHSVPILAAIHNKAIGADAACEHAAKIAALGRLVESGER